MNSIQFRQQLLAALPGAVEAAGGVTPEAAPLGTASDGVTFGGASAPAAPQNVAPPSPVKAILHALAGLQTQYATAGAPLLVGLAGRIARDGVTQQQESMWARGAAFAHFSYNSDINPRLDQICRRLGAASSMPELKLTPILDDKQSFNAQASGAGYINVTQGLVSLLDDAASGHPSIDGEPRRTLVSRVRAYMLEHGLDKQPDDLLAAFVAHEIGHVEHRDVAANWGQHELKDMLGSAQIDDVARPLLMEMAPALQDENWGMELKADKRGTELLRQAGYPPQNIRHMLEILRLIEDVYNKPKSDHDHPPLLERLSRLPA